MRFFALVSLSLLCSAAVLTLSAQARADGGAGGTGGAGGGTSCIDLDPATFPPLSDCASAPPGSAVAFFCLETTCTAKGKSCKTTYESCVADEGCSDATYCGSQCGPEESSIANCAHLAGAGLAKALALRDCQTELASRAVGDPPSACGPGGAGGSAGQAGGGAAGQGGAGPATSCVNADPSTFVPLLDCASVPSTSRAALYCEPATCTVKGKSCKDIYESCADDKGCSDAIACGSMCAPGESPVANCAQFAGSGLAKALAFQECQNEIDARLAGQPPSMCPTTGGGGSGAAGKTGTGGASSAGSAGMSGIAEGGSGGSFASPGSAGAPSAAGGMAAVGTAGAAGKAEPFNGGALEGTSLAKADDGCGCAVPGATSRPEGLGLLALASLAIGLRHRRTLAGRVVAG